MWPSAHSVVRAVSKVPGSWNADGKFPLVCAKWGPLYPIGYLCVRLPISVLTKERLGCELSSKTNLSIKTRVLGFTVSIGKYIGSGYMCYKAKVSACLDTLMEATHKKLWV